jgi:flagellar hook-length control protein FliK
LAIPKDKLGVFSKLLEGLLRNSNHPQGSDQIPDKSSQTPEESVSTKKSNSPGIKFSLLSRNNEKTRGKEKPDLFVQDIIPGKKTRRSSPARSEEDQDLAAEEAAFLGFPEKEPEKLLLQKTNRENSTEPFSGDSGEENPILSEEITSPVPYNKASSAGIQEEDHPQDRKAGKDRTVRDPAELSPRFTQETEPVLVRLTQAPGKVSGDTEKTGSANPRRNDSGLREKRRERVEMEVRDLRTGQVPEVSTNRGPVLVTGAAEGIREVELRLELPGNGRNFGEGLSAGAGAPARAFEEILAGEIRGGLGDDIVRQASIILKDGGTGFIRLTLRPESLGNVKIRLEMAENKIAGRIIVESNEALRAFEREMQSLEQAFKDSGFNGASIEMSVSSDNGGNNGNRYGKGEEATPFFSERLRLAASDYESREDSLVFRGNSGNPSALGPVNMLI